MNRLIIATKNKGKVKEFETFFKPYEIKVLSLNDIHFEEEIEETGTTFAENALIKAKTIAMMVDEPVLADDSGLEVPVLNNEPGIYSARYSGKHGDDQANNNKLLDNMRGFTGEERKARFVCALALVTKDQEYVVEGTCEGLLLEAPVGEGGFGYDPLFYVPSADKTFAQLTKNEKEKISHRGDALNKLKQKLFGEQNE